MPACYSRKDRASAFARLRLLSIGSRLTVPALAALFALGTVSVPAVAADLQALPGAHSPSEQLRLGERIYREGILPSGAPVQATVQGDIAVDGRMFSCVNCHRRSGMGSTEGGIVTPANSGAKLFQPSYFGREFTPEERSRLPEHYRTPMRRPAYTEETLARAVRNGVDPAGRALNPAMPRYALSDRDMAVLIAYLKSLSAEISPGVTEKNISFAAIVTAEVPSADAAAMLATLDAFVAEWNSQAGAHAARAVNPEIAQEADLSYRTISIRQWHLDGAPATWRRQLEAYYRKEPVFALLSGITTGEWRPVHEFSEENRIPCILPITELPVVSKGDWYTLYFSKGLFGEGEAAAASLGQGGEVAPGDRVLQLYRDTDQGRAFAAGFQSAWAAKGRQAPVNRVLSPTATVAPDLVRDISGTGMPQALVAWLGSESVPLLERLAEGVRRPKVVYLSAQLLGPSLWNLSEPVRDFASFSYPYRLPQDDAMHPDYAKAWLRARQLSLDDKRIASRTYSLMLLMNQAIPKMRRNFFRDNLLDQIDASVIHGYPDYDRLSFAPGKRFAAGESHVVTLSRGPSPILLRKSE